MALNEQCESAHLRQYAVVRNLCGAVLLTTAIMLAWFVNHRLQAHHHAAADAVTERRSFERRQAAMIAEHERLSTETARATTELEALRARLPLQPDEARVVAALSKIAEEQGLAIQSMRPSLRTASAGRGEVDVHIAAVGEYESVCRFLDAAGKLSRVCRVSELSLSDAEETGRGLRVEVTFCALFGEGMTEKNP